MHAGWPDDQDVDLGRAGSRPRIRHFDLIEQHIVVRQHLCELAHNRFFGPIPRNPVRRQAEESECEARHDDEHQAVHRIRAQQCESEQRHGHQPPHNRSSQLHAPVARLARMVSFSHSSDQSRPAWRATLRRYWPCTASVSLALVTATYSRFSSSSRCAAGIASSLSGHRS